MDHRRVHFADFCFDPETGELTRQGVTLRLEPQPARVLARLLAAEGRLVTRDELVSAIWGDGTHVNFDDGLNYCVRQVRAALDDAPKSPRFIETVPRRGYRFVAPVASMPPPPLPRRWRLASFAAAAAVAALVAVAESLPNNHHDVAVAMARAVHNLLY